MPWRQIAVGAYLACVLAATFAGLRDPAAIRAVEVGKDAWLETSWARDPWSMKPADRFAQLVAGTDCAISRSAGDFDGDGADDVALVYALADPCDYAHAGGRYRIAVLLSNGAIRARKLGPKHPQDTSMCLPWCTAFAAADLDADGRDELVVSHGHGSAVVWFGVYSVTSASIRRLATKRGNELVPAEFRVFGSLCCGSDFACRTAPDGTALVVQASYGRDIWSLHYDEVVYAFDGRVFIPRSSDEDTRSMFESHAAPGRRCLSPNEHVFGSDPRIA